MIICVFLLFVAGMATTTVERDCHEGMRVVDTDKECNLKYGSICPNMVEWCAAWEISPNGPVYKAETERLRQELQREAKGARLLRIYKDLPLEWQKYASVALGGSVDVITVLSLIDSGHANGEEMRRIREFEAALKRAKTERS